MHSSEAMAPLSVSQLTQAIKLHLESSFPHVLLQGEISNFKAQSSGHLYFSLKDVDAQIAAVMFKADAALLKSLPKGGDKVIVKAELNVYPPKGNYQLIVRELSYAGIGELIQQLEKLKIELHQRGWFKSCHKKPLPQFPKIIGVVTSPTGAVIQDILNILSRRFSGFHLILNPVRVQGEGAAEEIAKAIEEFNQYALADVLIVGRGGGSLEDLWPFNEEVVATAIFHSRIPIISAVGHETDHCIADYVADVRAPTPSAAAEIVIAEKSRYIESLRSLAQSVQRIVSLRLQQSRSALNAIAKHPLFSHPHQLFEFKMQRTDDMAYAIDRSLRQQLQMKKQLLESKKQQLLSLKPSTQMQVLKQKYDGFSLALDLHMAQKIAEKKHKLHCLEQVFKALDPKAVLAKGYAILFAENGNTVIKSPSQLAIGQQARVLMSDGEAIVTINKIITP